MMNSFWTGKKVLITGGAGFIGSHVVEKLIARGAKVSIFDNLRPGNMQNLVNVKKQYQFIEGDCRNENSIFTACKGKDVVFNLAAKVAGVDYNKKHKGTMLSQNLLISASVTKAAAEAGIERFLVVSSACVYPDNCSVPTPEDEGVVGDPESANSGYGWAKRMSEILGKYYQEEFGIKVAIVRPYNCYGPRDHFLPIPTHVVPSLIKRVVDGENPITVWGSGNQTRAFLHVEDLSEGMILAVEKYAVCDPVNLGTDEEVTMKELVEKIIKINGRDVPVVFDTSKPDGSPRRNSDNKKAFKKLGFKAKISLEEGLKETIQWYKKQNMRKLSRQQDI
ncbi:MAG: NAD-dependent epimerase/dehydratase family protein [Candidatus Levyibacteriota bacterium]